MSPFISYVFLVVLLKSSLSLKVPVIRNLPMEPTPKLQQLIDTWGKSDRSDTWAKKWRLPQSGPRAQL